MSSVARLPDSFWLSHLHLVPQALRAIDGALARLHNVDSCEKLPDELSAERTRLSALLGNEVSGGLLATHL